MDKGSSNTSLSDFRNMFFISGFHNVTRPPALPPPDKLGFHHSTVSSAECEHTALPTDDQWKIIESI
ncbi:MULTISPECIES: hypothetical protein, partial [unclassified Oceanispirochaeta]|uniref:hypothetical protein n=1 Tax=unclassified Oceanispirochaeta TaxID=2635722 RepID=UPI001E4B3C3A